MRQVLLIVALAFLTVGTTSGAAPALVNEVHSYKMTIEPDTPQATVTLRVNGASMQAPFKWSVVVTNVTGNVLFQVEHDDAWLDKFFGDDGYINGCKGHEECKQKWYFQDLPKTVSESFNFVKPLTSKKLEKWEIDSLNSEAGEFLKNKGLSESKRSAVIAEMESLMINGKYAEIWLVDSPVQQGSNFMYVPSLGYFVPFWHD